MLRRKRSAAMSNWNLCSAVCVHWAWRTSQIVVFCPLPVLQNAAKSPLYSKYWAPAFMASMSKFWYTLALRSSRKGILVGVHMISVGPFCRVKSGVVPVVNLPNPPHPDVRGQHAIELPHPLSPVLESTAINTVPIEVGIKGRRMHTRVSAATTHNNGGRTRAGRTVCLPGLPERKQTPAGAATRGTPFQRRKAR